MDSLVAAAMAAEARRDCAFLHVTYGQRTARRELKAFGDICAHYKPKKSFIADISYLGKLGGSSLTDASIPVPTAAGPDAVPSTYVPFRNAHLLSIAASMAEVDGAEEIYIGATQVDYSGYPDCRREFFDVFESAIDVGTRPSTSIRIITPIINMTKAEIVAEGVRLAAPFELSWSCYVNSEAACGKCESCRLRLKGFYEADAKDPIPYT